MKWLFKKIYPYEWMRSQLYEELMSNLKKCKEQTEKLEKQQKGVDFLLKIIQQDAESYFKIHTTSNGEKLLQKLTVSDKKDITITLWEINELSPKPLTFSNWKKKLEAKIVNRQNGIVSFFTQLLPVDEDSSLSLWIDDIQGISNNGFGTLLIEQTILIARQMNCKTIRGELSPIDLADHRERLLHFYKKLGFTVTLLENNTGGLIQLELY